ncbi:MAG TPA: GNAT family N-acetyltransferase [Cellulomonas sp.]
MHHPAASYALDAPHPLEMKALHDATGWGSFDEAVHARALAGTWRTATARSADGSLVGMGRLISDGAMHAFVTEMIVREDVRGHGIGSELLRRLVAEATAHGITDVQLFAAAGRRQLYERHGFEARPDDAPGMGLTRPSTTSRRVPGLVGR